MTLAAGAYVTPHDDESAAGSSSPRPLGRSTSAAAPGGSGMTRAGCRSRTETSTFAPSSLQVSCTGVPACTIALVTSSLASRTASATSSSRPDKPQEINVLRINRRASATAVGSGAKAASAFRPWCVSTRPPGANAAVYSRLTPPSWQTRAIGTSVKAQSVRSRSRASRRGAAQVGEGETNRAVRARSLGEDPAMTETPASSRVTQRNGIRRNGAGRAGHGAADIVARSNPEGSSPDPDVPDNNGRPRYTEADLKPIRARLAAFARGDFRPRAGPDDRHSEPTDPGLAEISELTDEIGAQLAAMTSEVAQNRAQVRDIAVVTTAVARGDLTGKVTVEATGEMLQLKQTVNMLVDQLSAFADEVTRVAREVGTEGRLGGQAQVRGVSGVWKDLTDNVNVMANNLTGQVRNIAQVATAVANGDLSKKIDVDARGEILELKTTLNTMVDQLSAFADEVTRVAREVGTEGRLGGQAYVRGVSGVWKDLTDNVNFMAGNLTGQVRNIAQVTTSVANGDLTKKIDVGARGEILELKTTINTMVDQLSAFAGEVTRVAREVGT